MDDWKLRRWKTIVIEGFQIQGFLSKCSGLAIGFRSVIVIDECSIQAQVQHQNLAQLRTLAGNRYRITEIGQSGLESRLRTFLSRSATCMGLVLFLGILFVQSQYITQVKITGYQRLTELQVRQALEDLGFRPGIKKTYDLADVKTKMFHKLEGLTWIGITYEGTVAKVELMEGTILTPLEDTSIPAHILSNKEGYVEQIMVKEGLAQKEPGEYIRPGDVLISGIIPIVDKTYQREEHELTRYVHAQGEVKARILYRFSIYQPLYSTILKDTGKWIPGLAIEIGDWSWDSDEWIRSWNTTRRNTLFERKSLRPIPWSITLYQQKEVTVSYAKRLEDEIKKRGEQQIRSISKEILPKDAEILKKDLSFLEKENIIIMNVLLHSLETVGIDTPIHNES